MCNANTPSSSGGGGSQPMDETIPGIGGTSAAPGTMGMGGPLDWLRRHLALTKSTPLMASGPTPDFQPGQGTTTDPETGLQAPSPGQITQAPGGGDPSTQVGAQTSPTKFGSLMKVLAPMLQGGLIGWAGGKGTPGGGFNAANNHFAQRRAMQMQQMMMGRQLNNDQFRNMLEYARTQHEMNMPGITRVPNTVPGKDASGNEVQEWYNPYSRKWEVVPGSVGKTAPKGPKPDAIQVDLDRGLAIDKTKGTYKPLVKEESPEEGSETAESGLPGGLPKAPTPQEMVERESLPKTTPASFTLPRKPTGSISPTNGRTGGSGFPANPKTSQPKPIVRANRDDQGNETDVSVDNNPQSPTFGKTLKTLPTHRAGTKQEKTDVSASVENYAGAALEKFANDPDKAISYINGLKANDPKVQKQLESLLPQIRQRIRERTKQGKKRLSLSPSDAAAAGLSPTQSSVTGEEDDE